MKVIITIIMLLAVAPAATVQPPTEAVIYLRVYLPKLARPVERSASAWNEAMPPSCGKRFLVTDRSHIGRQINIKG